MSSWAHDADEQEKLLSRLTDKVSGVNIDGSGDAGRSGYRETSSDAGSERPPSGHHEPVSRGEKIQDHVILGTPGKIVDWALKFNFFDLSRIKVFVLDEADIMIAMHGHH
ncbi:hypothetical protein HPB49_017229 [Dermacentor silvarum]|uniref:Uncharacterized protein n=1 Tax=Dermacentor silvarum TaxID=543639 RepID=A0ACB8DPK0_DERSI|nr:hypothetical protein HPB49_017229 [Dermacentor silvarum]